MTRHTLLGIQRLQTHSFVLSTDEYGSLMFHYKLSSIGWLMLNKLTHYLNSIWKQL